MPDLTNPQTLAAFTQVGFAGIIYAVVVGLIYFGWNKLFPFYSEKRWPAEHALRQMRIQADIEARKDELGETRLMRQALEKQNAVAERLALLIEKHDDAATEGFGNVIGLLRIVLEKQGVDPSQVSVMLKTQVAADIREALIEVMKAAEVKNA